MKQVTKHKRASLIMSGLMLMMIQSIVFAAPTVPSLFTEVIEYLKMFAKLGGGLWLVWGVIILAGALKDKNGPGMQNAVWQIVGGAMIIASVLLFDSI